MRREEDDLVDMGLHVLRKKGQFFGISSRKGECLYRGMLIKDNELFKFIIGKENHTIMCGRSLTMSLPLLKYIKLRTSKSKWASEIIICFGYFMVTWIILAYISYRSCKFIEPAQF